MITEEQIKAAEAKFGELIRNENARIEAMKKDSEVKDCLLYTSPSPRDS